MHCCILLRVPLVKLIFTKYFSVYLQKCIPGYFEPLPFYMSKALRFPFTILYSIHTNIYYKNIPKKK